MSIINIINEEENSILSLVEIKNFLRIDFDNDDQLLLKALNTATRQCELCISKTLNKKTYVYSTFNEIREKVFLQFAPILSIEKIETLNIKNIITVINESNYIFDNVLNAVIFKNIPTNIFRLDTTYKAGFEVVSDDLKQGLLYHIAKLYEDKTGFYPIPKASNLIYKNYKKIKL